MIGMGPRREVPLVSCFNLEKEERYGPNGLTPSLN
jgi:hypothetical protein